MKQLTGNQIRQMFLDYFKSKGHMIEPGASLIPHNDPTNILMVVKNRLQIVLRMRRNQFVRMILKMWVVRLVTTHSLKC